MLGSAMRHGFVIGIALAALVALILGAGSASAQGGDGASVYDLAASPADHHGRCPTTVTFTARISTFQTGPFSYRWERSDGVKGPVRSIPIAGYRDPKSAVDDSWRLTARHGETLHGWEKLHLLTPYDVLSDPAAFQQTCR